MFRICSLSAALLPMIVASLCSAVESDRAVRSLPVKEYVDKMAGGWVGQMAGVGWGTPIEFAVVGQIVPPEKVPVWKPDMVNEFDRRSSDDLWVEMTFIRTLERHGLDVSIRQAGIDYANSRYPTWCSDETGRGNLRKGIAPPDCSHPKFNPWADDLGYQIQSDFAGLVSPGLPNMVISLGEKFGRLTAYGDGLYAGQFMGGMYAEAFFERDPVKLIEAGLRCIPKGSRYHEAISDTLRWYKANPDDWQKTWKLIEEKYNLNAEYRRTDPEKAKLKNIMATINGAYIAVGMLYGGGDPEKTMLIAMRCGQDNDCNPSSAGGVIFTSLGLSAVPDKYKSALNRNTRFLDSTYDFPALLAVCEQLGRQVVVRSGGRIEKQPGGEEVFVIPVQTPQPIALERTWEPGPITGAKYSADEMKQIKGGPTVWQKKL